MLRGERSARCRDHPLYHHYKERLTKILIKIDYATYTSLPLFKWGKENGETRIQTIESK